MSARLHDSSTLATTSTLLPNLLPPPARPPSNPLSSANSIHTQRNQNILSSSKNLNDADYPSKFQPYFTLIANLDEREGGPVSAAQAQIYHPSRVHYLFSDDEEGQEALGEACLGVLRRAQQAVGEVEPLKSSDKQREKRGEVINDDIHDSLGKRSEVVERYDRIIVVDVNATGDKVVKATSLTDDWQVTNAEICGAPIWDNEGGDMTQDGNGNGKQAMMMRLEGVGRVCNSPEITGLGIGDHTGGSVGRDVAEHAALGDNDIQALMEGFDRKMAVLRRIIGEKGVDLREGDGEGDKPD